MVSTRQPKNPADSVLVTRNVNCGAARLFPACAYDPRAHRSKGPSSWERGIGKMALVLGVPCSCLIQPSVAAIVWTTLCRSISVDCDWDSRLICTLRLHPQESLQDGRALPLSLSLSPPFCSGAGNTTRILMYGPQLVVLSFLRLIQQLGVA